MSRRPEWDDDFLDEMMNEVREAVLEVSKGRNKQERFQSIGLYSKRNDVEITVRATRRKPGGARPIGPG